MLKKKQFHISSKRMDRRKSVMLFTDNIIAIEAIIVHQKQRNQIRESKEIDKWTEDALLKLNAR